MALPSQYLRFQAFVLRNIALPLKFFFVLHLASEWTGSVTPTAGPSMLPTLAVTGDIIYTSKRYARGNGIEVGDLIDYKHPMEPRAGILKRVMGLPGDFVREDGGVGSGDRMIQVPEGHCWLLGDNEDASRDSRTYGPLPMALIRGKVTRIVWPPSSTRRFKNPLQRPEEDL